MKREEGKGNGWKRDGKRDAFYSPSTPLVSLLTPYLDDINKTREGRGKGPSSHEEKRRIGEDVEGEEGIDLPHKCSLHFSLAFASPKRQSIHIRVRFLFYPSVTFIHFTLTDL